MKDSGTTRSCRFGSVCFRITNLKYMFTRSSSSCLNNVLINPLRINDYFFMFYLLDNGTPMRQLAFPVDEPITFELEDAMRTNDLMRYKLDLTNSY